MRHGVQFDVHYAYSKPIALSSSGDRVAPWQGIAQGSGNIINSWDPNRLRAVSDFDTTHQFNTDFIVELPFGRGKEFARNANGFANAVVGGWELSRLSQWPSGFPVQISNGDPWAKNWQLGGDAIELRPARTGLNKQTTAVPTQEPNL